MRCSLSAAWKAIVEEAVDIWHSIRDQRCTLGFLFAVICVLFVIVGNVILLIGINFWLTVFPVEEGLLMHNSSQIAIQVVASMLMVIFFTAAAGVFVLCYGGVPLWRALTDTKRMRGPLYRGFLLVASGASNGICGILGVYSMSHTPEFLQAVLLCCIPFSAQVWTVIFIPEERKRNYLSLFFVFAFLLFVAGVLLSSITAFTQQSDEAEKASWEWTLIYLLSCVAFGLWCVIQRLYLDAMIVRDVECDDGCSDAAAEQGEKGHGGGLVGAARRHKKSRAKSVYQREEASEARTSKRSDGGIELVTANVGSGSGNGAAAESVGMNSVELVVVAVRSLAGSPNKFADQPMEESPNAPAAATATAHPHSADAVDTHGYEAHRPHPLPHDAGADDGTAYDDNDDDEVTAAHALLLAEKRSWGRQSVSDNAAKLLLLVAGLLFQLIISLALFPVDAIPWFGTSSSVGQAWDGLAASFQFIFHSWVNMRYGLLYTLGYIMSFIGCTFLNEHSPTLASVVLQLAGPVTSLAILIIPQWNVYHDSADVGHKVGGVILLLFGALLYHVWEQRSLRELLERARRHQCVPDA